MADRITFREDQWQKIYQFLQEHPHVYVGGEGKLRTFMEAILWMSRSGAQWRLLPAGYGNWNSVYKRFARWCEQGIWEQLFQHFVDAPDMEWLIIDSTIIRAHPCAAGTPKKTANRPLDAAGAALAQRST